MCKPILPLAKDQLAHIFWQAQHLATVHHHHGDHHAEVEIAAAEHEENDNQAATTRTSDPVSVHIALQILYIIPQPFIHRQKFAVNVCHFSTISLENDYPPPKHG